MRDPALNLGLAASSLSALAAACLFGSTPMDVGRVFAALLGQGSAVDNAIIWQIRLPRALSAFLVGAALGASGAALQGLLRNPLAEPGVLGVSASAALCASGVLLWGGSVSAWSVPVASVIGALIATAIIAIVAWRTHSILTLILVGVGLSSLAGALMSLMLNLAPHPFSLTDLFNWTLGSVANRSFMDIAQVSPFLVLGAVLLAVSGRSLSALTLGEATAASVGVNLVRLRVLIVLGAGLATGASVALAGAIGFVGIVAPHLIRPLCGHDPARSLLPAAMMAGLLLVIADIGVRLMPGVFELKLGVLAALIGAPLFMLIVLRRSSSA